MVVIDAWRELLFNTTTDNTSTNPTTNSASSTTTTKTPTTTTYPPLPSPINHRLLSHREGLMAGRPAESPCPVLNPPVLNPDNSSPRSPAASPRSPVDPRGQPSLPPATRRGTASASSGGKSHTGDVDKDNLFAGVAPTERKNSHWSDDGCVCVCVCVCVHFHVYCFSILREFCPGVGSRSHINTFIRVINTSFTLEHTVFRFPWLGMEALEDFLGCELLAQVCAILGSD